MKNSFSKEPSLQNKRAVNIANKMGKRYTLLDAMLMGKKLKIDWKKSKFTMGDLLVGMHYELEHGKVDADTNVTNDNALKTAKIAWAHLKERPDYYVQLMKIDPPKKMEKKANSVFTKMEKRGLTPTGVISSRTKNMQLTPGDRYTTEGNAIVAQSHRNISKELAQLGKQTGIRDWGNNISSNGATAKRAWDWAVNNVKNPPGKTMEDIRDNAIQKYLSNARASRKYTKASNTTKEYLAKRASDELNDMVKEAAARWKKEFGNLSSESQKILRDNFVDEERYVRGLQKGNENLIKKMNIKVLPTFFTKRRIKKEGIDVKAMGENLKKDNLNFDPYKVLQRGKLSGPMNFVHAAKTNTPVIRGLNLKRKVPSLLFEAMARGISHIEAKRNPEITQYKGKGLDREAFNAITLRHEIDEIRSKRNNKKTPKEYYTHQAPDVLHRESANLTFMPKSVRDTFTILRGTPTPSNPVSEKSSLKTDGDIHYGESAYFDKKRAKKHLEKLLKKE
jgi:hypothetical protein